MRKKLLIRLSLLFVLFLIIIVSCETKPTAPVADNPLDTVNSETSGDPFKLTAKIADGGILLEWDNPQMKTISAFKVYRSEIETNGYTAISTISKDKNKFTDRFIQNGRSYWYRITALDENNKESEITNIAAVNVKTEPILVINGGDKYTMSREIQLTILSAGAVKMMLSNNIDFAEGQWEDYNTSKNWLLYNGDGQKIVYMKIKYDNGNESDIVSRQVLMDTTPPKLLLSVMPDSGITDETIFEFDATNSYDNLCPKEDLRIRYDWQDDGVFDTEWSQPSLVNYMYSVGGGDKTVRIELKDSIGWKIDTTINLFVNTRPQISFYAILDDNNYKLYHFDASESIDYEDNKNLEYRWDFNGDGSWDTEWLLQDTISYEFADDGDYNIKLSIRDQNSLSNEKLKAISILSFLTDIDGNVYKTVKIGNQVWMAENLRVKHYRNGDAIPNTIDSAAWVQTNSGAYCFYNNDSRNDEIYGLLYNGFAVNDGRKVAPEGWHIPSDAEWKQLEIYLGMSVEDADKVEDVGQTRGIDGATNETGFTALPSGSRGSGAFMGEFDGLGTKAIFWAADERWMRELRYNQATIIRDVRDWRSGYSIRCVKDE